MTKQFLSEGAEAKIYLQKDFVSKERIVKTYRHPILDEKLRKQRTKREAKLLQKALASGINVPKVLNAENYDLEIEYLPGEKLSQTLNAYKKDKPYAVMKKLGAQVAKLHENNIIHGDLTTSNTLLCEGKVFIIDFGLGYVSQKIEDKAVDLHLIKQALEAKHYKNHEELYKQFLEGYKTKDKTKILERLKAVEKRGRYRH